MSKKEQDVYYIPPNFIESGTVFGGTLKLRNVLEAGVLCVPIALVVLRLPLSLTVRIIVLCLTGMPVGIVAVVGVSGESLSSFAVNFLWFLKNRKVVGAEKSQSRKKRERARHTKTKGKESVTEDEEFT